MEVIRYTLVALAALGLCAFSISLTYLHNQTAAIWTLFLSIFVIALHVALYWHQKSPNRKYAPWLSLFLVLLLALVPISLWQSGIIGESPSLLPDTRVHVVGQKFSYPYELTGRGFAKIVLSCIRGNPEGTCLGPSQLMFEQFTWDYPKNTMLYNVTVQNEGDATDFDVQVTLDFTPYFIIGFQNRNEDKVVVQGGLNSTRVTFTIDRLDPHSYLTPVRLVVDATDPPDVSAQSGGYEVNYTTIDKVYIWEAKLQPMPGWESYEDRANGFALVLPESWSQKEHPDFLLRAGQMTEGETFFAVVEIWKSELPQSMTAVSALSTRLDRATLRLRTASYDHLSEEHLELNGLTGYKDTFSVAWPDGQVRAVVLYLLQDKTEWFVQMLTAQTNWSTYEQTFDNIASSFDTRFIDVWLQLVPLSSTQP